VTLGPGAAHVPDTQSRCGKIFCFGPKELEIMAMRCEICGKGPVVGRRVSHAHNVRPRRFEPNLQTVKAIVDGARKRVKVCTRCLRSNKITKAA
jgi:large subunit ribosomal protein L28